MLIRFREWEFEVDKQTTEHVYQAVDKGGAQTCGCNYCQNFLLQQESVYPSEVIDFFEALGIDFHKESEVVEYGELNNGLHLYNSWFHFAGKIVKGESCAQPLPAGGYRHDLTTLNEIAKIGFWVNDDLSYFPDGIPLVQIEFEISLPWRLN